MATARNYSNSASQAATTAALASTDTSIALSNFTGYPTAPFTAALARGTATEEIVLVTAVNGSTVTVTRGYDGTIAQAQGAGTTFQEVAVAQDFRDANAHVVATTGVHGVTGAVVGTTDVQTLTNKTLTSPSLTGPTSSGTHTIATAQVTTLNVSGVSTLTGNTTVGGTLGVTGTATLAGAATVGGTLSVTGRITAPGKISIFNNGDVSLTMANDTAPLQIGINGDVQTIWDNNEMFARIWNTSTGAYDLNTFGMSASAIVINANASGGADLRLSGTQGTRTDNAVRKDYVDGLTQAYTSAAITLSSGWAISNTAGGGALGTITEAPKCWMDSTGTVHCTGAVTNTTATTGSVNISPWITLPSGYRPKTGISRMVMITTNSTGGPAITRADINTSGVVALNSSVGVGTSSLYSFDWTFRVTN